MQQPNGDAKVRGFGLVLTNATKLAGLVLAVNEGLIRHEVRPVVLGVSAFMMAGAQSLETFIEKFFGR